MIRANKLKEIRTRIPSEEDLIAEEIAQIEQKVLMTNTYNLNSCIYPHNKMYPQNQKLLKELGYQLIHIYSESMVGWIITWES